jgi:FAD/FMN-containing dehydrogenase
VAGGDIVPFPLCLALVMSFPFVLLSLNSRYIGTGVDNVLQFTIVLSNGSLVTANSYQHPDLFWALRGGGGGTYGVVTSASYKTYSIFPLTEVSLSANFTSPDIAQKVATELIKLLAMISDLGWGASSSLSNSTLSFNATATNASLADTNAILLPFVQYANETTGGLVEFTLTPFTSFYELYLDAFANTDGAGGFQIEIASRLLPRSLAETDPAKAAKIMLSLDGGVTIM